jgi:hypothetical protein
MAWLWVSIDDAVLGEGDKDEIEGK